MARKNTVLSPFERVTWDQWQSFTLERRADSRPYTDWWNHWGDPRFIDAEKPDTAIGPNGERLYSISIAPNHERAQSQPPYEECRQWLLGLMHKFPAKAPETLPDLANRATRKFPGLSKRAFRSCYLGVCAETGNWNWSRAGAPTKSRQKSLQKK
jgi:hypothetical protein